MSDPGDESIVHRPLDETFFGFPQLIDERKLKGEQMDARQKMGQPAIEASSQMIYEYLVNGDIVPIVVRELGQYPHLFYSQLVACASLWSKEDRADIAEIIVGKEFEGDEVTFIYEKDVPNYVGLGFSLVPSGPYFGVEIIVKSDDVDSDRMARDSFKRGTGRGMTPFQMYAEVYKFTRSIASDGIYKGNLNQIVRDSETDDAIENLLRVTQDNVIHRAVRTLNKAEGIDNESAR